MAEPMNIEEAGLTLRDIIQGLKDVKRFGAERDEPEGACYIQLSDTLTRQKVEELERIEVAIPLIEKRAREKIDKEWYDALLASGIAPSVLNGVKLTLVGFGKKKRWQALKERGS